MKKIYLFIVIGLVLGIIVGIMTFYHDIEPMVFIHPKIDLLYLYIKIDRVGDNVTGISRSLNYIVTYIALLNISNSYNYTVIPREIAISIPRSVSIDGKSFVGYDESLHTLNYVVLFDSSKTKKTTHSHSVSSGLFIQHHYVPKDYTMCWIPAKGYNYIVIHSVALATEDMVKWFLNSVKKNSTYVFIHMDATILDKRGSASSTLLVKVRFSKGLGNEYYIDRLPKGVFFHYFEICDITFEKYG